MANPEEVISQETLERLVARAVELDEQARDGVSVTAARAIARELGISASAWDTAVVEHRNAMRAPEGRAHSTSILRPLLLASLGLAAGAAAALIGDRTDDVAAGAVLVAWSFAFALRARNASAPNVFTQLAAWWAAVPLGMMLVHGEVLTDPVWFAAFSWTGSSVLARYVLRHHHKKPSAA